MNHSDTHLPSFHIPHYSTHSILVIYGASTNDFQLRRDQLPESLQWAWQATGSTASKGSASPHQRAYNKSCLFLLHGSGSVSLGAALERLSLLPLKRLPLLLHNRLHSRSIKAINISTVIGSAKYYCYLIPSTGFRMLEEIPSPTSPLPKGANVVIE